MAAELKVAKKELVRVVLNLTRETPGTYVYATNEPGPIQNIYIRKSAFAGKAPMAVTLVVEE